MNALLDRMASGLSDGSEAETSAPAEADGETEEQ